MANIVDCIEEEAVFDDSYQSNVNDAVFVDAAALDDAHAHGVRANTEEAAVLDDVVDEGATVEIAEAAILNDAVQTLGAFDDNAVENPEIVEDHQSFLAQNITETAVLDDALSAGTKISETVEAAVLNDAVNEVQALATNAVDAAVLADAAQDGVILLYVEEAVLNDAITGGGTRSDNFVEAAVLDDAVVGSGTVSTEIIEIAVLNDATSDFLTAAANGVDVGYLNDAVVGGGNAAWRTHVEPWALSRYTNMPWNSMATIGGALFAAGPEGIYQLAGADDNGTDVDAEIVHDWLNWAPGKDGSPVPDNHLKRPRYLYLEEVKVAGQLALSLGYVTIDGAKSESEYPLPSATATGFVNVRVPLGRGIRSQHLRPTITNVDGADFEYNNGRLVVDALARSI
jgi:hypothetical protein